MYQKIISLVLLLCVSNGLSAATPLKKNMPKNQKKDIVSTNTYSQPTSSSSSVKSFFRGGSEFQNEFLANFSAGELSIEKPCKQCDSNTTISLQASYLHHLQDKIQVGVEGGLTSYSNNTLFDLIGVGAYNFDADFKNAFYAKAGLGFFSVAAGNDTETKFGLFLGGGKRFALFNNVTYSPELRLIKKGDLDISFLATFLNFSLYWN
jgi:hypothetical protein